MELEVSQSEYPSESDDGVSGSQLLDKWMLRAHHIVDKRIPSSTTRQHRKQLETLVAAHFGFPHKTEATEGRALSSVSQNGRTVNFNMDDVPGDTGSTPYWLQAVELDSRINDDESGDFTLSV